MVTYSQVQGIWMWTSLWGGHYSAYYEVYSLCRYMERPWGGAPSKGGPSCWERGTKLSLDLGHYDLTSHVLPPQGSSLPVSTPTELRAALHPRPLYPIIVMWTAGQSTQRSLRSIVKLPSPSSHQSILMDKFPTPLLYLSLRCLFLLVALTFTEIALSGQPHTTYQKAHVCQNPPGKYTVGFWARILLPSWFKVEFFRLKTYTNKATCWYFFSVK